MEEEPSCDKHKGPWLLASPSVLLQDLNLMQLSLVPLAEVPQTVLKLELDLAVGPKKPFPQVEEELELEEPRHQKKLLEQEELQQAVDPPNAVLLLVMMNARGADQQTDKNTVKAGISYQHNEGLTNRYIKYQ
jgi:hypothetical protein